MFVNNLQRINPKYIKIHKTFGGCSITLKPVIEIRLVKKSAAEGNSCCICDFLLMRADFLNKNHWKHSKTKNISKETFEKSKFKHEMYIIKMYILC